MEIALKSIFWLSLSALAYTYFGYPLLVSALVAFKKKRALCASPADAEEYPLVSLMIPAYNEEAIIRRKIDNSLELDYPPSRLEIVVASDGSTDRTNAMLKSYSRNEIRAIVYRKRQGKTAVINKTIPKLMGDIVVLSDASAMLAPDAIKRIIEHFKDPGVGCVSGKYILGNGDESNRGKGEGLYFRYESFLKSKESKFNSILGAHGSLYAIRKALFQPLGEEIINDDYIIPMQVVAQGYRSVYAQDALSVEVAGTTIAGEAVRRRRINIGNVQQLVVLRNLLNPRQGKIAFQFISHKLLRLLSPLFLLLLLSTGALAGGPLYRTFFILQLIFHGLGLVNWYLEKRSAQLRLLFIPFYFTFGMWTIISGLYGYLRRERATLWERPDTHPVA